MIEAMRDRALNSAAAGLSNVEVHLADATMLPLPDASVDVVISNGVLNLVPEKEKAFRGDPAAYCARRQYDAGGFRSEVL
jgi:arsenite methyltransferase